MTGAFTTALLSAANGTKLAFPMLLLLCCLFTQTHTIILIQPHSDKASRSFYDHEALYAAIDSMSFRLLRVNDAFLTPVFRRLHSYL